MVGCHSHTTNKLTMRTRFKALALASLLLACTCALAQTEPAGETLLSNVRQLTFEGRRSGERSNIGYP